MYAGLDGEGDGFIGFVHQVVIDNYLNHHESEALGRKYVRMSLGGMRDEASGLAKRHSFTHIGMDNDALDAPFQHRIDGRPEN